MNRGQTRTYLLYSRGLMPDDLTLGSLHLDPANPIDNETRVFLNESVIDSQWLRSPCIDIPCSISANVGREWLAEAGLSGVFTAKHSTSKSSEVTVSGKRGRRIQLKDSERVLNDIVLASEEAHDWLAKVLVLRNRMTVLSKLRKAFCKPPRIWMVTGLQYLEDATASVGGGTERVTEGSVKIPPPDLAVVAAMADINAIDVKGSVSRNEESTSTYGHQDERIWAAQFRALDVRYHVDAEGDQSPKTGSTWIALHGPENIGGQGIREGDDVESGSVPVYAEIAGMEEDCGTSVLETMLDVDWALLDELLYEEPSDEE